MTATSDKIKVSQDGIEGLVSQLDKAIVEFAELQKAINSALDNLDASLVGSSKHAFSNKSTMIKNGLVRQNNILEKISERALTAMETMFKADKQIAANVSSHDK